MIRKILFSIVLLLFFTNLKAQTISQRMQNKSAVSIYLNEEEMNEVQTSPMFNFFIGEFAMYLKDLGVECGVNWGWQNKRENCQQYDYVTISFYGHVRLASSGCWVYDYSNVQITFVPSCKTENAVIYKMKDFTSHTTSGSLKRILHRKLSTLQPLIL